MQRKIYKILSECPSLQKTKSLEKKLDLRKIQEWVMESDESEREEETMIPERKKVKRVGGK